MNYKGLCKSLNIPVNKGLNGHLCVKLLILIIQNYYRYMLDIMYSCVPIQYLHLILSIG